MKLADILDQKIELSDVMGESRTRRGGESLNVVHLCMQDFGGAGIAAYRLHKGLRTIGARSTMITLNKLTRDPTVKVLPDDYSKPAAGCLDVEIYNSPVWNRQSERWNRLMVGHPARPAGLEMFTDAISDVRLHRVREVREADLINLHWVAGTVDWPSAPEGICDKPVVWTLHDMNAFTGGCHYAGECKKYMERCGACPQLGSGVEDDVSRRVWEQKREAYGQLKVNVVTPSRWLGKCASESALFSDFPVHVIPYGFPLDSFQPRSKAEMHKALRIPDSVKIILFGAQSVLNERKGFKYLLEALNTIPLKSDHKIVLLTFGHMPREIKIPSRYTIKNLGRIAGEEKLSMVYSAADVFVVPTLEDNLPNTVVESMACGAPVVGFDIGGMPDMIEHEKTGYLAKPGDIQGLIDGIDWALSSADGGGNMMKACRDRAEKYYALEMQANRYKALYERIWNEMDGRPGAGTGGRWSIAAGSAQAMEGEAPREALLGETGEKMYRDARALIENNKIREAAEVLETLSASSPGHGFVHNDLGVLHHNEGDNEKALRHLERAAELEPENASFQKDLADVYMAMENRLEEALGIYVRILEKSPKDVDILKAIGQICLALEKYDEAENFFRMILTTDPWNRDALDVLDRLNEEGVGEAVDGFGGGVGAVDETDSSIPFENEVPSARALSPSHHEIRLGEDAHAPREQSRVEQADNETGAPSLERLLEGGISGEDLRETGSPSPTISRFHDAIRLGDDPDAPRKPGEGGRVEQEGGEAGAPSLERILESGISGEDLRESGKPSPAVSPPDHGAPFGPGDDAPEKRHRDALALMEQGDNEAGVRALERLLEEFPGYAPAHNDLGVMFANAGDAGRGLRHHERAVDLAPENTTFRKNLADVYMADANRLEDALRIYVEMLEDNPEDVEILTAIGRICLGMGKYEDAKRFYDLIVSIEPWNMDALDVLDRLREEGVAEAPDGSGVDVGAAGESEYSPPLDVGGGAARAEASPEDGETAARPFAATPEKKAAPKEPLVSAIVSTYNAERFIRACLEDLEAQTIADQLEIIVIDSNSPENERTVVEEFQRRYDNIVYIRTKEREGVYAAWNRGIKAARGRCITNANTDDRHRKEAFAFMVNALETHPDVVLVYGDVVATETENETYENCTPAGRFRWRDWDRKKLLEKECFIGPQPMWRKSVHDEYGYFDESFVVSGDYEFWARISQTHDFLHLPHDLGLYLQAPESVEHANLPSRMAENRTLKALYRDAADKGRIVRRPGPDGRVPSLMKSVSEDGPGEAGPDPTIRVSIILPADNQRKVVHECLESIRECTAESHEIIIVDNGAAKGVAKWLKKKCRAGKRLQFIKGRKNARPAAWRRQGIEASGGNYLLFLHNDVVVSEGWLTAMLDALEADPLFGLAGPMTNACEGIQNHPEARFRSMDKFRQYAGAFRTRNRNRRVETRELSEFCLLCRREVVEAADGFDERYKDDAVMVKDLCTRAAAEGWRSVVAADALIFHHDARATPGKKTDRLALVGKDRGAYLKKWRPLTVEGPLVDKIKNRDALDTAIKLFREERVDEAVKTLADRIVEHPGDNRLYLALARFCLDVKRYQEALDALDAIPPDPSGRRDARTLALAAACLEGLEKYIEAQTLADEALRLRPDSARALNVKGLIAYNQEDKEGAEKRFNRAMAADPGYGEPFTNLGSLKWQAGDQEEALPLFARGFTLGPVSAEPASLYHTVTGALNAFEEAETAFREAAALYPDSKRLALSLIEIYIGQDKKEKAMAALENALQRFGIEANTLSAALTVREALGPMVIDAAAEHRTTISLCMIVKNEEKRLADCLKSAKPAVDEMIVVDTGSSDRTRDIAIALGARVYDFPWNDNFSDARNHSLSKANGGWVFLLDGDEVLSPVDYPVLRGIVSKKYSNPPAFTLVTRNYTVNVTSSGWTPNAYMYDDEEAGIGWFPSSKVRLFPNREAIRFQNPVHEFVEASLKREGVKVKKCPIPIHHYGRLDEDKMAAKGEAYYLMGKRKIEESEDKTKAIHELAVQAGELKKYDDAVELWSRVIRREPQRPLAHFNLGYAYLKLGRYEESLQACKEAMAIDPDHKEVVLNYANCELYVGDVKRGVAALEKMLKKNANYPAAMGILAALYYVDGRKAEAMRFFNELRTKGFNCAEFLNDFAGNLISVGRFDHAIRILNAAVESTFVHEETKRLLEECMEKKTSH